MHEVKIVLFLDVTKHAQPTQHVSLTSEIGVLAAQRGRRAAVLRSRGFSHWQRQ